MKTSRVFPDVSEPLHQSICTFFSQLIRLVGESLTLALWWRYRLVFFRPTQIRNPLVLKNKIKIIVILHTHTST
jgi:hypothetical protein